jgi:hypothetical protein
MADDRVIHTGVRLTGVSEGKKFTKGPVITDPDELEKAAAEKDSGIDLQALYDAGAISGTWKGVKATDEEKAAKKTKK